MITNLSTTSTKKKMCKMPLHKLVQGHLAHVVIVLVAMSYGLIAVPTAQAAITRAPNNLGLVGYWPMNDARGTRAGDASGQGNHGTLTGGPTWIGGKLGYGLRFDGTDDYVTCSANGLDTTLPKTISAWVKFNGSPIDYDYVAQFSSWTGDDLLNIAREQTTGRVYYANNGGVKLGPVLAGNTWLHVAMVFESATSVKFYLNGETQSIEQPTAFAPSGALCRIGAVDLGGSFYNFTNGSIDDVRIYNRALGAAEVARLYAAGQSKSTASNSNGLVAHWSFTDCKGLRATDFSGQGNHGTLTGGPTWGTGRLGCGLAFDGVDDYVDAGDVTSLNSASAFAISGWAKQTTLDQSRWILGKATANCVGTSNCIVMETYLDGNLYVEVRNGGASYGFLDYSQYVTAGTWFHFTAVFDGSQSTNATRLKLYIDGVQRTLTYAGTIPATTGNLSGRSFLIGQSDSGGAIGMWNGSLDDVRIYNRALSAAEVSSLYASGVAGVDPGVAKVNSTQKNLLTNGLVGYWGFNGADTIWSSATAGTTRDLSGQGNTGTLTNMSQRTSPVAGKSGQALSFDGTDDYVDVGSGSSLNITGNITLSTWVKTTDSLNANIIGGYSGGSPYAGYGLGIGIDVGSAGKVQYWDSTSWRTGSGATTINDNQWHHIVVSVSGATATFYKDGVSEGTSTATAPSSYSGARRIGYTNLTNPIYLFPGSLDEVRIYNRALSAAEVKELYNLAR